MTINTGFKILMSRWRKENLIEDIIKKRELCAICEYNSLNMEKIPLGKRLLKRASDFYSFICGKLHEDNLGNCTACESCSIFFKTADEEHCPHPLGDKWKSVYIPNSAQKNKKQWK
jgi:hypothetical protein